MSLEYLSVTLEFTLFINRMKKGQSLVAIQIAVNLMVVKW